MTVPVARRAARVLLVDGAGRVLLFRGHDPARPDAGTWWFTVGGGLDEGESPRAAAARELLEETGLSLPAESLVGPVHAETAEFSLAGTEYRQDNEFFVARIDQHEVDTAGFTDFETSFMLEHRWWTAADLRSTAETVYPESLPALLERLEA
jgi:8-oxo-dGTP pyrophosphatase MutT (NUDIX family)